MKKKFLSLMMAAAVVATTSVSAFANQIDSQPAAPTAPEATSTTPYKATGENTFDVSSNDTVGKKAEVEIQGDIAKDDGTFAPNTMSITVPTNARFAVDQDGNLTGSDIVVKSKGVDPVSVIAYKFMDLTKNDKITVVSNDELKRKETASENNRKNVTLTLQGNTNTAYLQSETSADKTGIYKKNESGVLQHVSDGEDFVLGNVKSDSPLTLKLRGTAGTSGNALGTAEQDNFTLILKFKKESKTR